MSDSDTRPRVLLVDDEVDLLSALKRQLRSHFSVSVAEGGAAALDCMKSSAPFAVIVSDMRMPEMNGVEFLGKAARLAPDTARIMLTGNADQQTAIDAVNEGQIYRFLSKPIDTDTLIRTIREGAARHAKVEEEHRLLQETLGGAVKMLMDVLTAVDPQAFGRATAMRRLAKAICIALTGRQHWDVDIAVMLAPLGWVTVPKAVAERAHRGLSLDAHERALVQAVPEEGYALIRNIPRLEGVAQIIRDQFRDFDGRGFPQDGRSGEELTLGGRILRVLNDLFPWSGRNGMTLMRSLDNLEETAEEGIYDPLILAALRSELAADPSLGASGLHVEALYLSVRELEAGDVLLGDLETMSGHLLLTAGQELSDAVLAKLRAYAFKAPLVEPIGVERVTQAVSRIGAAA